MHNSIVVAVVGKQSEYCVGDGAPLSRKPRDPTGLAHPTSNVSISRLAHPDGTRGASLTV